ncbi:hypothetical protein K435DRAFT_782559 [Dendrothele bispora CBS 962.96]|uniref:Uncharacterized protein n=1 Tax=Dendrothele bispora (strain CBS 962.96) TaxID=1314807 RepID=A0A4S8LE88_DENBC|nr:hypothetical protein K435DRAFT_782559 [Dendrothele bispora CBS 962.96]
MDRLSFWSQNSIPAAQTQAALSSDSGHPLNPPLDMTAWTETESEHHGARNDLSTEESRTPVAAATTSGWFKTDEGTSIEHASRGNSSNSGHSPPWVSRSLRLHTHPQTLQSPSQQQPPFVMQPTSSYNYYHNSIGSGTVGSFSLDSSSRGLRLPPGIPHSPPIMFDRASGNTTNTVDTRIIESTIPGLYPTRRAPMPPTRSSHFRSFCLKSILSIPFFPLLGVLYTLTGHAILRATSSSPSPSDPYQTARLISSCESGAVGGAILAVPLILLFYFIYAFLPSPSATVDRDSYSTSQYTTYTSPHAQSPDHLFRHGRTRQQGSRPDDFFDDSSSSSPIDNFCCSPFFSTSTSTSTSTPTPTSPSLSSSSPLLTTLHYVAIFFTISMILTIGIGASSGSLGFTVLHAAKPESFVSSSSIPTMSASPTSVETETGNRTLMLSAVDVVKAGLIGAAVVGPVVLAVFWVIGRGVVSVVFNGRKG